ncbi:MAG TPA: DUF2225 domain-containing protein [Clostridium sp.]|nr:DUF2225 domain-containing protein [Clostridium sp.]
MYNETLNNLFDKNVTCPVCSSTFKTKVVKSKSARIVSKDSDFFIRYSPKINPYFYDVWICNSCGYSALKSDFDEIRTYRKELVMSNITPKWQARVYPDILDEKLAIERYKIALLNAILTDAPESTKAMISLKIAWMFRLLGNEAQENAFLGQALNAFTEAYTKEIFPIYGLQRDSMMYLLGELNRRMGNYDEALVWFSKTIVNTNSSYRVKELARMGKESIKNM